MWRSKATSRCHEIRGHKISIEGIVLWRGLSCLDLPNGSLICRQMPDCDSHRPNKVNYSIPRPNTRVKNACIEEYLNFAEYGVAHITSVLETDCPSSHWHIARLPSNSAKRCWAMQAKTMTLCDVKVIIGKHDTLYRSTNNVESKF